MSARFFLLQWTCDWIESFFFSCCCLFPQAQQETQKAALRYERAVSMHTAAREMVYVAEQGLLADRNTMDATWQEMLNHATAKVDTQVSP